MATISGDVPKTNTEFNEVLDALFDMFNQYCWDARKTPDGRQMYNHACMSPGENVAELLIKYGQISKDQLVYP